MNNQYDRFMANNKAQDILDKIRRAETDSENDNRNANVVTYTKLINAADNDVLCNQFKKLLCLDERGEDGSAYIEIKTIENDLNLSLRVSNHHCNPERYEDKKFVRLSVFFVNKDVFFESENDYQDSRFTEMKYRLKDLFSLSNDKGKVAEAKKRRKVVVRRLLALFKTAVQYGIVDLRKIKS